MKKFNLNSTVGSVRTYFGDAGNLLFPVDRPFDDHETLAQISDSRHYIWYSHLQADKTVEIINYLAEEKDKRQIFYPIYSKDEISKEPEKRYTGLYFLRVKKVSLLLLTMLVAGLLMWQGCRIVFLML